MILYMKKEYVTSDSRFQEACGDMANRIFDILKEYGLTVKETHTLLIKCAKIVGRTTLANFPTKDGKVPDWVKSSLCDIVA